MKEISVLGIDLAKNIFQLHGADRVGNTVLKKKLNRRQLVLFVSNLPKCVIAMEACGGSHYWGRKFGDMGHQVKLISPQFVKPFVKSNKNDANDAEAIVEAALRPNMRFVSVKTTQQQEALCVHRVSERLIGARTALINSIRARSKSSPKGRIHDSSCTQPCRQF
jgi:transposase